MREINMIDIEHLIAALGRCEIAYHESTTNNTDDPFTDRDSSADTLILPVPGTETKTLSERVIDAYHADIISKAQAVLLSESEKDQVTELQHLLLENWDFIKGSLLCYTALPDHSTTQLLIQIAYFVGQKTNRPVINCLMPTVATDSIHEKFPDLTQLLSMRELLYSHILSDKADYLIPIRALTLYDLGSGPISRLLNPYFDFSKHPTEYVILSEKEMIRLKMHSPESEALFVLIERYHTLLNAEDNLLLRLQTLIRLMSANSVNGLGTELLAARGGMIAIADFFNYYHTLNPTEIQRVPKEVRDEIAILLDHGVAHPELDDQQNQILDEYGRPKVILKNSDITSCLGIRSRDLRSAIDGYENILYDIGLSDATKTQLREQLVSEIQRAYETLQSSHYHGSERLGFTAEILSTLDVPFSMTFEDLKLFNLISPEEVKIFCRQPSFIDNFINMIHSADTLVMILTDWNAETIKAAFTVMGSHIARALRLYNDYKMFLSIVTLLNTEKCRAVLEGFKNIMHHFVQINSDLRFLTDFPDDHYQIFCEVSREKWIESLTSTIKINHFFYFQRENTGHCQMALTVFANHIQNHCTSPQQFATIVSDLNDAVVELIYRQLKPRLITYINNFDILMYMMLILEGDNKKDLIDAIAIQLPRLIPRRQQLSQLMRSLDSAYCDQVLRALGQAQINNYFNSIREKRTFVNAMDQDKQAIIHAHLFPAPTQVSTRRPRENFFMAHSNSSHIRFEDARNEEEERPRRRHRRE